MTIEKMKNLFSAGRHNNKQTKSEMNRKRAFEIRLYIKRQTKRNQVKLFN